MQKALETIEEDSFKPRSFFSTKDREAPEKPIGTDKVIIDLNRETVTFATALDKPNENAEDEIFHANVCF